ncbi:MAG: hypothetical protein IJ374_08760 [Lachnospiraceae bacterium]|nr:hypothetical protein [Lachnospiraceae bacterium]
MRSKTPLALMEQLVMVLVFALAAVMCLQIFGLSDRLSRKNEALSEAALLSQNAAEQIKSHGGVLSEILEPAGWESGDECWFLDYDKNWQQMESGDGKAGSYRVEVREETSEIPGLKRARISVTENGETIFQIPVAWQEVEDHE